MRRFSANYIYPIVGKPIRNGIVGVDSNGTIIEIIEPQGNDKEYPFTEFHNGVIVPGFVNAHCHTELSHLKNTITKETGLAGFVAQIRESRIKGQSVDKQEIEFSLYELKREGIVAVGDICNTSDSFFPKRDSGVKFVNFIELLGIDNQKAEFFIDHALALKHIASENYNSTNYLTPHSVYSLSEQLWEKLSKELTASNIISIHYCESNQEQLFTQYREGEIAQNYLKWGLPLNDAPKGKPIDILKKYLPKTSHVLFIHNTYLNQTDAMEILQNFSNSTFVLCPSSNLFIEKRLADIPMLKQLGANIALGTDSLASSPTLSILEQIRIILSNFASIDFVDAIRWATLNGAQALNLDRTIGSLEIGKTPGLNLITNFDFSVFKPTANSRVINLV